MAFFAALLGGAGRAAASGAARGVAGQAATAEASAAKAAHAARAATNARAAAPPRLPTRGERTLNSVQDDVAKKQRALDAAKNTRRNATDSLKDRGDAPLLPGIEEQLKAQAKAAKDAVRASQDAVKSAKQREDALNKTIKREKAQQQASTKAEDAKAQAQVQRLQDIAARDKEAAEKSAKASAESSQKFNNMVANIYYAQGLLQSFSGLFSGFVKTFLTSMQSLVQGFAEPIAGLVELVNPAIVKQFQRASNDAFAIVGRIGVPVLESLTRVMQKVGDFYAKVEPSLTRVSQAVSRVFDRLAEKFADIADKGASTWALLAAAAEVAIEAVGFVADVVLYLAGYLARLAAVFSRFLGFKVDSNATSKGAAIRSVTTTNSAEDVSRKAIEQAFMQAMGSGAPKQDTPSLLMQLGGQLGLILKELQNMLPYVPTIEQIAAVIAALPKAIADALSAILSGAVSGAKSVVGSVGGIATSAISGLDPAMAIAGLLRSALTR